MVGLQKFAIVVSATTYLSHLISLKTLYRYIFISCDLVLFLDKVHISLLVEKVVFTVFFYQFGNYKLDKIQLNEAIYCKELFKLKQIG